MRTEKKGRKIGSIIYTDHRSRSGFIISNDANYKIYYFKHESIDRNYHQFGERVFFEVKKYDGKEHAEEITVVLE